MNLEERFTEIASKYSNNLELINTMWIDIKNHYSEKHRTYHNLLHLEELFRYYDSFKRHLENADNVAFSIFYHDILYNIWKTDNEEQSANYALEVLSNLSISSVNLEKINSQICCTKTHDSKENDAKWMIDFDLAIIGKSQEVYKNYSKLIRKEYRRVPWFLYKKGRKKVLKHFIDKPFIYSTDIFRNLYEEKAKQNLKLELSTL